MVCSVGKALKDGWGTLPRRVKFWLLGGVLPTLAALILLIFGDMWVGYTLRQSLTNHFLDFCLSTFTLAVSIFSAAVDVDRQIDPNKRVFAIVCSAGLGVFCAIIFSFLYYRKLLIEKGIEDMTPPQLLCFARLFFVIVALLVIQTGIVLERETVSPPIQPKTGQPAS